MIHRVYRLLAQRYHPDNGTTGDEKAFRAITDAYKVLSEPEKRAAYDVNLHAYRQVRWRIFDQRQAAVGKVAEKSKRKGILDLLYTKRCNEPEKPTMNLHELEDLLGCPREHLEFSLWYLKENGLVTRMDNGRFSVTAKGVDWAEQEEAAARLRDDRLLPASPPARAPARAERILFVSSRVVFLGRHGTMAIMVAAPVTLSKLNELEVSLNSAIRGKPEVVRLSMVCLLARGHLLIEDVPGVGKTTLAQALARSVHCGFHRLQFTSDMLPSDVLGVTIYNAQTQEFQFKPGPVFTNFLLADEINRATPKTQSALLEAMNEVQVTIEGHSHALEQPFMVVATQNPVEHHGTYPLPESQLDRFLMRIRIGYPGA